MGCENSLKKQSQNYEPTLSPRARAREAHVAGSIPFTVVFYGSTVFCCKTAHLSEPPM